MPATSIFISAASSGTSGIGNSRISILLGPTRTAARTCSAMLSLHFSRTAALGQLRIQARINPPRISFEDLVAACMLQSAELVDVALGIIVVMTSLRIDAFDRAQHLRCKQDVVDRNDLRQQFDARIVIDAGV